MEYKKRIVDLKRLIPKLKANKKIHPLKIESLEWELRALVAENIINENNHVRSNKI
jgi:hypothetical protein